MKSSAAIFLFTIVPQNILSRMFGYVTRLPLPSFIMGPLIRWYSKKYGVLDEYVIPDKGFRSFEHFFTRALMPDSRPIHGGQNTIVSPVDARIDQYGSLDRDTIIQAKGLDYSIRDLIPAPEAERFMNGSFMTLYLSPGDYHRIHSPVSGDITGYLYIPGRLFTVQEYMVNGLKGLFTRNERLITFLECHGQPVALCKIGAMNVGRIGLSYDSHETNGFFRSRSEKRFARDEITLSKGDEVGMFHLGSTVIVIFPPGFMVFNAFTRGQHVKMGEAIGVITASR
jgi:phosphatidylserine decarboxylase